MKVLIVTQTLFPSTLGGQAKTVFWLGQALSHQGYDVDIITTNMSISEKCQVEYNKWIEIQKRLSVYYADVSTLHRIRGKIQPPVIKEIIKGRSNCYDVLILCSIFYIPGFVAALFAKRIIWSPRGELFDSAINGSLVKKLYISVVKHFFSRKTIYHATSSAEEKTIRNNFGKRVKTCVIPNLMEVPKMLAHDPSSQYLLFVGRISPIKALDNLVLGLHQSESFLNSDFKLIIVGEKEEKYEHFYQKLIKLVNTLGLGQRIIFAGVKDGEEKFNLYANAYFSFLVSHSENFGNVIIESLSQGTPVIASKGTPWGCLEDYRAGFWIDNNPTEISSIVNRIISMDKKEYLLYRNNARTLSERFDINENIDRWTDIIEQ